MKNYMKFAGIIVLVLIIGISMTVCATTGSGTSAGARTLTITGLEDYNDFYVYAEGAVEETKIVAAINVFESMGEHLYTGKVIKNGTVTLPIWKITVKFDEDTSEVTIEKTPYTGNINTIFGLTIWQGGETLNRFSELEYNGEIYITDDNNAYKGAFGQVPADDDGEK
ncbi:MAG: hypothetical protein LBH16_09130 [Treponema sp.]|jgi:beta-galactosidase GanA|nr:hypothetical protein [Treponema sp.]